MAPASSLGCNMEYYESKCKSCNHTWRWTGYKTGIGKTPEQLEQMKNAGKTCPACGGEAEVGLDHSSDDAKALDEAYKGIIESIFGAKR